MKRSEIIEKLQSIESRLSPVDLALFLGGCLPNGISQFQLFMYFKAAFPQIPFARLQQAMAWGRISDGGLDDAGFNDLLRPWIGVRHVTSSDSNDR